jgi:hypothetical protein
MRVSAVSPHENTVVSLVPTTVLRSRSEIGCRGVRQQTFLSPDVLSRGLV